MTIATAIFLLLLGWIAVSLQRLVNHFVVSRRRPVSMSWHVGTPKEE